jgi:hypothetical protein
MCNAKAKRLFAAVAIMTLAYGCAADRRAPLDATETAAIVRDGKRLFSRPPRGTSDRPGLAASPAGMAALRVREVLPMIPGGGFLDVRPLDAN